MFGIACGKGFPGASGGEIWDVGVFCGICVGSVGGSIWDVCERVVLAGMNIDDTTKDMSFGAFPDSDGVGAVLY